MGAAEELFNAVKSRGIELLREMVDSSSPREEDLWLDFKTAEKGAGPLAPNDKKTLAKALSGFANADGGVIIWGVKCKASRDSETPDVAQELQPIGNLKRFHSDLMSHTSALVSPPVEKAEHHRIDDPSASDTGYVVTYVPKGERDPHMALAKEQHTYYVRLGSSFRPMEAYMVADRFKRRPQPVLELITTLKQGWSMNSSDGFEAAANLVMSIRNVGRGVAVFPALWFVPTGSLQFSRFPSSRPSSFIEQASTREAGTNGFFFAAGANHVIHPMVSSEVITLECRITDPGEIRPDIQINYGVYCDGFALEDEKVIPWADILAIAAPQFPARER